MSHDYDQYFRADFEKKLRDYHDYRSIGDDVPRQKELFDKIMKIILEKDVKDDIKYPVIGSLKSAYALDIRSLFDEVCSSATLLDFATDLSSFLINATLDDSSYRIVDEVIYKKGEFHPKSPGLILKHLEWGDDESGRTDIEGIEDLVNEALDDCQKSYNHMVKMYEDIRYKEDNK